MFIPRVSPVAIIPPLSAEVSQVAAGFTNLSQIPSKPSRLHSKFSISSRENIRRGGLATSPWLLLLQKRLIKSRRKSKESRKGSKNYLQLLSTSTVVNNY